MSCERAIEVEDWTLGLLDTSEGGAVAAHVETCAECRAAKAMFEEERALFAGRAAVDAAPLPELALPRPSAVARFGAGRAVSAIAALAACVAAAIGGAHAFAPADCAAPAATAPASLAPPPDEVLTCKAPLGEHASEGRLFSEPTPAPLASHEPATLACVDRATCELQDDAL